ncbi:hypothetical protein Tco_1335101 [Tanacetum coccineum]
MPQCTPTQSAAQFSTYATSRCLLSIQELLNVSRTAEIQGYCLISKTRGIEHSWSHTNTTSTATQGTDPKDKGKELLKIQGYNGDAEERKKRFEELKKTKPKTTLRKPTSLAQERNQMMSFLKGQG